jgi:poly(3-hydroxybutyrate) depolymerase
MYAAYKFNRTLAQPVSRLAGLLRDIVSHPLVPMSRTSVGRAVAVASELLERATRRHPKMPFGFTSTVVGGERVTVRETTSLATPFCTLVRFERATRRQDPKVLLVAPLSGHHAPLLRDTVERLLPDHDVYVTDWIDARLVPVSEGRFDLDDYVALVQRFIRHIGPGVHVLSVCQPCVAVLAAVSLLEEEGDPASPRSMTLMAGPVDTRVNPTVVNRYARSRSLRWFELTAIYRVPWGEPGFRRRVYPGFLQLAAFMSVNPRRHVDAHRKLYRGLVDGDDRSVEAHRRFYDDYLAVMDLPAEYYLQTIETVFQRQALPRGEMRWRGRRVRPELIRRAGLMTVEGSRDDFTGAGQTSAAHAVCSAIPAHRRERWVQPGVGHFGVFSGRRWREEIAPRVISFIRSCDAAAVDGAARRPIVAVQGQVALSASGW